VSGFCGSLCFSIFYNPALKFFTLFDITPAGADCIILPFIDSFEVECSELFQVVVDVIIDVRVILINFLLFSHLHGHCRV